MEFKPLKRIITADDRTLVLPEGKYEYAITPDFTGVIIVSSDDETKNIFKEVW